MKLYIKFLFIFTLHSCSAFYQNDFITSKEINNSSIFYDLYQTGIDNYRYDFMLIDNLDTIPLFSAYLNDAIYKGLTFDVVQKQHSTTIISNWNIGSYSKKIGNTQFELKYKTKIN